MSKELKSLLSALGLFILSLVIGILGFSVIEHLSFVNALYMTVITVSTVGFAEVKELSAAGRIFTSIYILLNLGLFAYVVSVVTSYFFEGRLKSIFKNYRSEMEINKLKNHVIVCGYGRNGSKACEELEKSGEAYVLIEKDTEIQGDIPDHIKWLLGDATEDDKLKAVGIERAKAIIITTPSDAANVFITLTARYLNEKIRILVRASNQHTEDKLYRAGADKVVMPDILGGIFMAQLVTKPIVTELLDLLNDASSDKAYHLEEVSYDQLKPECRDKTLKQMDITSQTDVIVLGVKDSVKGIIPSPPNDTLVSKGDYLILMGSEENLQKFITTYTQVKYSDL